MDKLPRSAFAVHPFFVKEGDGAWRNNYSSTELWTLHSEHWNKKTAFAVFLFQENYGMRAAQLGAQRKKLRGKK